MNKKSLTFLTHDIFNKPVTLEWEEIAGQTDRLSEKINELSEILVPSYAQTEVEFARKKPEDVPNDFMLQSLASLLGSDPESTNWELFREKTEAHLKQFFATHDWKKSSGVQDRNIFVVAKDNETHKVLGVLQFIITPDFEPGTIKAALSGVILSGQNRGLEKLLMSSIFKIIPDVKRIFLHTRSTNEAAIQEYKDWGFTEFTGNLPNWTDLEYLVNQSDELQKLSAPLISQD